MTVTLWEQNSRPALHAAPCALVKPSHRRSQRAAASVSITWVWRLPTSGPYIQVPEGKNLKLDSFTGYKHLLWSCNPLEGGMATHFHILTGEESMNRSHEQRSLVGHSPQGRKEMDTAEWLSAARSGDAVRNWEFQLFLNLLFKVYYWKPVVLELWRKVAKN